MAPFEALYGRRCRTPLCWSELSEGKMIGPDLIRDTEDKVRIIRDRLKAASDCQKSYADLKRKDVEYAVGDKVFLKVSPWKKILRFGRKEPDLTYEEEPVRILAREIKELRNKRILLVKVLWRNHKTEEATWESEDIMRQQHPQLFTPDMLLMKLWVFEVFGELLSRNLRLENHPQRVKRESQGVRISKAFSACFIKMF
ncbi:uncharacterized protein LOC119369910 [Jatropha curcas]|uniref:uncharacterized protein LOC119369910 n=1 Tax=Jatropha curcas TaxID=180498 RepID=UPI0018947797|nr:uncharacterized protein LOC119369910 [Jatropha curcas]